MSAGMFVGIVIAVMVALDLRDWLRKRERRRRRRERQREREREIWEMMRRDNPEMYLELRPPLSLRLRKWWRGGTGLHDAIETAVMTTVVVGGGTLLFCGLGYLIGGLAAFLTAVGLAALFLLWLVLAALGLPGLPRHWRAGRPG